MRWPWQPNTQAHSLLVFCPQHQGVSWAIGQLDGPRSQLLRCGHSLRSDWTNERDWQQHLRQLGHGVSQAWGVLALNDYQLLLIDTPNVPPDELKAAARWRIRDQVDGHIDDITLDVLRVGAPAHHARANSLLVVAAPNPKVSACTQLADHGGWPLKVIDTAGIAQRNLHIAASAQAELHLDDRASACLVRHASQCLLTICVGDELYYSRRLEWDPKLLQHLAPTAHDPLQAVELLGDSRLHPDDSPRLLIELQRSFDMWERAWPELPMGLLWLDLHDDTEPVGSWLQEQLGLRVQALPLNVQLELGPWAEQDSTHRRLLAPLLGALLRREQRLP